jgi:hypothetical protein
MLENFVNKFEEIISNHMNIDINENFPFVELSFINYCQLMTSLNFIQSDLLILVGEEEMRMKENLNEKEKFELDIITNAWNKYLVTNDNEKVNSNRLLTFLTIIKGLFYGFIKKKNKEEKKDEEKRIILLKGIRPKIVIDDFFNEKTVKRIKIQYRYLYESRINSMMDLKREKRAQKKKIENMDLTFHPNFHSSLDFKKSADIYRKKCYDVINN